jgi:hypothetical protein
MSERKTKVLKVQALTAKQIAEMAPVESLETPQDPAIYCEIPVIKQRIRRLAELHHLSFEKANKIIELLF